MGNKRKATCILSEDNTWTISPLLSRPFRGFFSTKRKQPKERIEKLLKKITQDWHFQRKCSCKINYTFSSFSLIVQYFNFKINNFFSAYFPKHYLSMFISLPLSDSIDFVHCFQLVCMQWGEQQTFSTLLTFHGKTYILWSFNP